MDTMWVASRVVRSAGLSVLRSVASMAASTAVMTVAQMDSWRAENSAARSAVCWVASKAALLADYEGVGRDECG